MVQQEEAVVHVQPVISQVKRRSGAVSVHNWPVISTFQGRYIKESCFNCPQSDHVRLEELWYRIIGPALSEKLAFILNTVFKQTFIGTCALPQSIHSFTL